MTSVVFICNLALSNIGKSNIVALTEKSAEARACNQFYEHARDTLLQSYPWRFAEKTVAMAAIAGADGGGWSYVYQRPTDCLKIHWVRSYAAEVDERATASEPPYAVSGDKIYSNLSPAYMRYTRRVTDPTNFGPLFVDALAMHLAARLVYPIGSKDPRDRQSAYQDAVALQRVAEMHDANEVRENSDITADYVEAR